MTIKRGGIAEPISGNIYSRPIPEYCPKCEQFGLRNKLGPRIYKEEELINGQIPYDADQWRMCIYCGHLTARHDIPQEGELGTDIEKITTKFTTAKREPEHYQKPKHRRGFNERLDERAKQGEIKDEDLRRELKKGANLISYSET